MRKFYVISVVLVLHEFCSIVKCATANSPQCSNFQSQSNIKMDENILGLWYGSEIISPRAPFKNSRDDSCVVVHLAKESNVDEYDDDQNNESKNDDNLESLRLTVDEGVEGSYGCRVKYNKLQPGNWTSQSIIEGEAEESLCSGAIQVLKADREMLALLFCNNHGTVFTIILTREPFTMKVNESKEILKLFSVWDWGSETVIKVCENSTLSSAESKSVSSASRIIPSFWTLLRFFI